MIHTDGKPTIANRESDVILYAHKFNVCASCGCPTLPSRAVCNECEREFQEMMSDE